MRLRDRYLLNKKLFDLGLLKPLSPHQFRDESEPKYVQLELFHMSSDSALEEPTTGDNTDTYTFT